MARTLLIALAALALLLPASASAAVTVGTGGKPGLAIDANGTAYIAWYDTSTSDIHYCRLPRGAAACDVSLTLPSAGGSTLYRPIVVSSGADVYVYNSRYGYGGQFFYEAFEWFSSDGGASFGAPTMVGTQVFDEAAATGGGGLMGASNADTGGYVQAVQHGAFTSARANLFPATYLYDGTVAFYAGTPTAIAVFTDASGNAQFRVSATTTYNSEANWNPASPISGYAAYPMLSDGELGLFLLSAAAGGGVQVRQFNGGDFVNPVTVLPGVEAPQASISQDARGRLHVVGPRFAADGIHLDYAYSDDGRTWVSGSLETAATEQDDTRVAAAPDHGGVAVWSDSSSHAIEVAPLAFATAAPPPVTTTTPPPPVTTTAPPTPVFDSTVVASGTGVLVKLKGSSRFVALVGSQSIPLGSTIDARHGRVTISAVAKKGGPVQTAQFYDGLFTVTRSGSVTQLRLVEKLASCGKGARAAAKKPKSRKLWGNGSGAFSTRGQYSAATVRGTQWLVQDTCAGTLTRVVRGVVSVRDFVKNKTVVVRAGKRYLAKARR